MDTDTDQTSAETTEVAVSPTPEVSENTGVETKSESAPVDSEAESTEAGEVQKPAYVPNYKLKVYDEEKELDDPLLKSLIKDAETEKKVKEIAQKYLGFDTVKARNERLRGEYTQYQAETRPIVDYYNTASKYLQKGDLDSFFDLLQIPQDAIARYAIAKAEEAQLDPNQRAYIQQQRQMAKQAEYLEMQNNDLQSQQQQQLVQFRQQELGWVLSRPDVNSVAQAFDQRVGRPGAFRQAVIDKGLAHHALTNGREDLSAEQATQEVMKLLGAVVQPTTPNAPMQGQMPIQQNAQPPIIPNVTGRGTSPVKKQIRSIGDLKKKRDELRNSS